MPDGLICAAEKCGARLKRSPKQGRNPKWCASHKNVNKSADSLTSLCGEDGCSRPVRARGVCNMHYKRLLRSEGKLRDPWNDRRRNNWHARRARMNGARDGDPVMLADLVARDGLTCRWCGSDIDLDISWPDPLSKSIDHVVPVSKGGAHELDNCQLMHLGCNASKGDRLAA